jgi:hypothetical protein
MSVFGTVKAANASPVDMEVFSIYVPSRDYIGSPVITKLNATDVITPIYNTSETGGNSNEILGGMYTLTLPAANFNQKGIYNLYIRPIEIRTKILDCGVLSSQPDVKGLVFDVSQAPAGYVDKFINSGLVGYKIEYLNSDGSLLQNYFKVITSSFLCEPVNQNLVDSSQKSIRYRFNDSGNLLFCCLTPTSAPSIRTNAIPFIGRPNQNVKLTNSFFNPVNIELNLMEYDISTLAIQLYGDQVKNVDNGINTLYSPEGAIYKQYDLFERKDTITGANYEIRRLRTNIDFNESRDNVIGNG